jgi:hypothetical protein
MPVDILVSHRDTILIIKAATKIPFYQSSEFIKEKQSHYRDGEALRACRSLRLSGFKKIGT